MFDFIALLAGILTIIGVIYSLGKDYWNFRKVKKPLVNNPEKIHEEKFVNFNYPKDSGIQDKWEKEGYAVAWVSPRNVETKKLEGYIVITEVLGNIVYSFSCLNSSGKVDLIFMGKRKSSN
ncbi:MAG: hypothetical protein ABI597_10035 [Gammaproteobacteria bacterium]